MPLPVPLPMPPRPDRRARRCRVMVGVVVGGAMGLAAAMAQAGTEGRSPPEAPADCRVQLEHVGGVLQRHARVGEVDRRVVPGLHRLLNHGPHDVRATFDRLDPRVLRRGQAEPARGRLLVPVRLVSLECLPDRAAASTAAPAPARPAAIPPRPGERLGPHGRPLLRPLPFPTTNGATP